MAKLKIMGDLFKGSHFEQEIIILCVRWYLRYKLSHRYLAEKITERGLTLTHTTIVRWRSTLAGQGKVKIQIKTPR